jgi:16S rRNA processing protein RimM
LVTGVQPAEVVVGRIVGTFGTRGEVKIAAADTDIFRPGTRLRLHCDSDATAPHPALSAEARCAVIESARLHKNFVVARLQGINDANEASALRGVALSVPRDALPPLEGATFREIDLIGMEVIDKRLGTLGAVLEVLPYPACHMLVVGSARTLVPMLSAYGMTVDTQAREIHTALPEGFEELR